MDNKTDQPFHFQDSYSNIYVDLKDGLNFKNWAYL